MTFDNTDLISKGDAQSQMELCIEEIWSWMHLNELKWNGDKIEFLHFFPDLKHTCPDPIEAIKIGSDLSSGSEAKNLGVIFDSDFT